MPLPQRVSQPTRDTLATQFATAYGSGPAVKAYADATAVVQRMPKPFMRSVLRKVTDVGTAAVASVEMAITQGATTIADGATDTVAGTVAGTPFTRSYSQVSGGTDMLTVAQVAIGTLVNCTATLSESVLVGQPAIGADGVGTGVSATVAPFEPNIPPSATSTFVLTITPIAAGAWSCPVSIANNDADENPYNWTIDGTAT